MLAGHVGPSELVPCVWSELEVQLYRVLYSVPGQGQELNMEIGLW